MVNELVPGGLFVKVREFLHFPNLSQAACSPIGTCNKEHTVFLVFQGLLVHSIFMHDGLYKAWRVITMDQTQPEIFEAGILVQNGCIVALDSFDVLRDAVPKYDLGRVTLCPGLINAHTHLGLSHLLGQIPRGLGFAAWAEQIFSLRQQPLTPAALTQAAENLRSTGTFLVADMVAGHGVQIQEILLLNGLSGFFFEELSGAGKKDIGQNILSDKASLAAHALYSTSPDYARQIKAWCRDHGRPFVLHLAEVPGENELFSSGQGEWADFLRSRKILSQAFVPPGMSAVSFAHSLELLDQKTIAVHCVQVSQADLDILAESGASICLCPRSNAWIGVGKPPALAMYAMGIPLCLGTDSLASNENLDLWAELQTAHRLLPASLTLGELLAMMTINPARVLGLEEDWGILSVGKKAQWAVVPQELASMSL